ncbi:SdpI family protein [Thermococcus barophilus]|uniref:DUF1648 domain-containing protein n=1 Tax=Thermococcus barophilus (strain DSM 11836 / MP) TaxID=391623 RepID=F0LJR5_THEBM|nr:DUF1648 domain-containing protein [Thermococcus barophilus]ADT84707.1 hypothetical protein TERMP_01732 [Thermococcus barophilus MP]
MAGIEVFNMMFEIFIAFLMFVSGLLTYIFRNKPNTAIGFRFGYTFSSKEAWVKVNTFGGKAFMAFGVLLFVLSLKVRNILIFFIVMIAGVLLITTYGYKMAREIVEKESLREPAFGEPKPVEGINVKPYLAIQIGALAFSIIFLVLSWDRLPEIVAIHFNIAGEPDNFAQKTLGVFLFPLAASLLPIALTYMAKDPMMLRTAPKMSKKGLKILAEMMTIIAIMLAWANVYLILYNAYNFHSNALLSATLLGGIGLLLIETFRLLLAAGTPE